MIPGLDKRFEPLTRCPGLIDPANVAGIEAERVGMGFEQRL
jgi:hypothetical protein